ncbi:hypothetical protein PRIPAC_80406 [Pristionchus pacificus]|uniref:SHSP domain-containing protein n=2 Tax=Pristionchus pacificus TaxID=54126 RepID=A0A2A6CB77_PRIPA|nr:hypothetical protein PRIPAC_77416 [Pristionchus pacificus]KAF8373977.1 hypothetical protein PRIPAC_80406 [Pristionchus pacificus]|eukprot:PDM75475.1 hypothetical protein PRIPAC_42652 [Pristionchus pacificus]
MSLIGYTPFDRSLRRAFDHMFDDDFLTHRSLFPYWRNIPHDHSLNLGSALGEVENTSEKFAVSVDVSHFKPEEIKVNLNGNELTIEGDHEEKTDQHGTIKRSFVRKYILPDDANVDSLRSSLNHKGHLTIEAPKKTQSLTQPRAIHITRG